MKFETGKTAERSPELLVYGGTFDPPHFGHVLCVRRVLAEFPQADVLLLPGGAPAGAGGQHKVPGADYSHREAMCELAFREFVESGRLRISGLELSLPSPNYTLNTLNQVLRENPEKNVAFVMGADQWRCFSAWKDPEEILRRVSIVIVPRSEKGREDLPDSGRQVSRVLQRTGVSFEKKQRESFYRLTTGTRVYFLSGEQADISSTELKRQLQESAVEGVHADVLAYIERNKLYRPKGPAGKSG